MISGFLNIIMFEDGEFAMLALRAACSLHLWQERETWVRTRTTP